MVKETKITINEGSAFGGYGRFYSQINWNIFRGIKGEKWTEISGDKFLELSKGSEKFLFLREESVGCINPQDKETIYVYKGSNGYLLETIGWSRSGSIEGISESLIEKYYQSGGSEDPLEEFKCNITFKIESHKIELSKFNRFLEDWEDYDNWGEPL